MGLSGVSFCHLLFSVLLPNPHVGAQAFKRGAIRHPSAVAEHTVSEEEETGSCFALLKMVYLIIKAVSEK